MIGVIEGGMAFVWAAYGITWGGLLVYGISLVVRYRSLS